MEGGEKVKEAAGEANMTVITIVLIGVVAAVGAIIIPRLLNNMSDKSCCQELGGYVSGTTCKGIGSATAKTTLKNIRNSCNN